MKAIIGLGVTGRPMNTDAVIQFYAKNLDFRIGSEETINEQPKVAQVEEKKMETVQDKKVEAPAFSVSAEQFKMLQEFEAKAAEEKSTSKIEGVAKKIYEQMQASNGPVI